MINVLKRLEQLHTLMELSSLINSTLDQGEIRKRAIEAFSAFLNNAVILKKANR